MAKTSPTGRKEKKLFLFSENILPGIAIISRTMDEIIKRKTAISIGLYSIRAARIPTKDDAQKKTATRISE